MLTNSEKQMAKLRQQLLNSQLGTDHHDGEAQDQGTTLTDFQNQLLQTKHSSNLHALKNAGVANRRSSPKNSDYIKQSILLSGGRSSKRFQLPRQQVAQAATGTTKQALPQRESKLMATESDEDCNSFIDEMEFDEDQPVLGPAQQTLCQQQFQSTAPAPQQQLSAVGASINAIGHRPVTQKNQTTQRDPLKHSLFHSFMLTQRNKRHVNVFHPETASHHSYLKSFRDQVEDAENQAAPQLNAQYRTATANPALALGLASGFSARSR